MSKEIPVTENPKVVTKVLSNQSAGKTDYQSRGSYLKALEGESRPLFTPDSTGLKRVKAKTYLEGEEKNSKALELIVSPKDAEIYKYLGTTESEREENIIRVTRQAMKTILDDLGASSARWVAAYHQNTKRNHLHILIGESYQDEDGNLKTLKRLPKEFLVKNEEGFSKLDLAFSKALREQVELTPENVVTRILSQDDLPNADPARLDEVITNLSQKNTFSANAVNQAVNNGTIVSNENAETMFVRRNAEGIVTGANWINENRSWNRSGFHQGGWFYIGDPQQAESIILVSSAEEGLALQSSHSQRDLRKVAIIALEPKRLDQELGNLLLSRQKTLNAQNKELNVVWATNTTRNGRQYSNGLRELKDYLNENRNPDVSEITFKPYQRETSWMEYAKKYAGIKEVQQILLESEINLIDLPQDIPFTATLPALPEMFDPNRAIKKTDQEPEIEENTTYDLNNRDLMKEAEQVVQDQISKNPNQSRNEAQLMYQEVTRKIKEEISLESIAAREGFRQVRYSGENVWIDPAHTKRIKISGELFSDRKNGMQGGKGTIDFVTYLQDLPKSSSFKEARQWLVDNFNVAYQSPDEIRKMRKAAQTKPPLEMSPANTDNIEKVFYYLETVRGINHQTLEKLIGNETLYPNLYGSPVFVHRNFNNHITGGSWRDIRPGSNLRGTEVGTDKELGCFYLGDPKSAERFVLVEAPIDALSYYDLEQLNEVDLSKTAIISLDGSYTPQFMIDHFVRRQIDLELENSKFEVVFATDNDRAGELAFDKFLTDLEAAAPTLFEDGLENEKLFITRQVPPQGKDWNDYLKIETGQPEYPILEELNNYRAEQKLDETSDEILPETENTEDLKVNFLAPELVIRNHSVTGKQLFIVDLKTRVPFDTYQEIEIKADELKGFFQTGYKPADVPGGFRFADEKTALEFIDRIKDTRFAFSRLVQEQANQIIKELPEGYADARAKYNELIAQKEDPTSYFESDEFAIVANYLNELANQPQIEQSKAENVIENENVINEERSESEQNANTANIRSEESISAGSMGDDGERPSGGISTAAIPVDEGQSDIGANLPANEFESVGDLSFSEQAQSGISSDRVSTGDLNAAADGELGRGSLGSGIERPFSELDQSVQLEDEKTYKFKLRDPDSPEFLEYKIGFDPVAGRWITTAAGLVGSKHQEAKKVDYFELSSQGVAETKLESLTAALTQINEQISKFDHPEDEFAPLYADIYRHNQGFIELFEEKPVVEIVPPGPGEIKKIVNLDSGFKVIFNDDQFTRSFNYRKGDGSRELRTVESVAVEAVEWRKECEARNGLIDNKADYLKISEAMALYADGKNIVSTNLVFDETDNLWRGHLSLNLEINAEKFIIRDKKIGLLNNGFASREELLINLSAKAIEKIENRAGYTRSETKKMFQDVILALQSKQAQLLDIEVELLRKGENEEKNEGQRESEKLSGESWSRSEQGLNFKREKTGEILVRKTSGKEREVKIAQVAGIEGFEDILESTFDFINKADTDQKLWFAKREDVGKPLFTITDKLDSDGQYVLIAERSKNSFDLNKHHNLTELRRINLTAARNAELIAFDEHVDALQIQSVKGEIFYSALVHEIAEEKYQNSFGLLEDDEQLEVLKAIEEKFAAFGFDGISNTVRVEGEKINKIRTFTGNWQAVGQYQGLETQQVAAHESENSKESLAQEIKAFVLEDKYVELLGASKINEIFKFNSLGEVLSEVDLEIRPSAVYFAGKEAELKLTVENIKKDYGLDISFAAAEDRDQIAYIKALGKPDFSLSKDEYVQKRIWQAELGFRDQMLSLQNDIDEIINLDRHTNIHSTKLRELNVSLEFYRNQLLNGQHKTDRELERFSHEYEVSVARDIKKGLVSPERRKELALTSPFLKTSVQNRERVEKSEVALVKKAEKNQIELQERAAEIEQEVYSQEPSMENFAVEIRTLQQIFSGGEFLNAGEIPIFSDWIDAASAGEFIKLAEKEETEIPQYISKRGNKSEPSLTGIKFQDVEESIFKKLLKQAELTPLVPFLRSESTPQKIFEALTNQYLAKVNGVETGQIWDDEQFSKFIPAIENELKSRLDLINQSLGIARVIDSKPQLEAEKIEKEIKSESKVIENPTFADIFIANSNQEKIDLGFPELSLEVIGFSSNREVVIYQFENKNYGLAVKHEDADQYIHLGVTTEFSATMKEFVKAFRDLDKDEKTLKTSDTLKKQLQTELGEDWFVELLDPAENKEHSFYLTKDDTFLKLNFSQKNVEIIKLETDHNNWDNHEVLEELYSFELDSTKEAISRIKNDHIFDQNDFLNSIEDEISGKAEIFDFELNPDRELVKTEFLNSYTDLINGRVKDDFRYQYLKPEMIGTIYFEVETRKLDERLKILNALAEDKPVINYIDIPQNFPDVEKRSLPENVIPTIGFTNEYYTLWNVVETSDGERFTEYVQNLSTDLETAKAKVAAKYARYKVDLNLRGAEIDTGYSSEEKLPSKYAGYEFHFGKLAGQDIRTSEDVWQLNRAREFEFREETRAFAHNRMVEMGELHQLNDEWFTSQQIITKAEEAKEINGWHLQNGDRKTLELTVKHTSWFPTNYGSSAIQIFRDTENRIYKYLGSSPVDAEKGEIVTVKGTIDHSSYQDKQETRLKRLILTPSDEKRFEDRKVTLEEALKELNISAASNPVISSKLQSLTQHLSGLGIKKHEFTEVNELSGQILYYLEYRVMEFETIPTEFIEKIAEAAQLEPQVVAEYLQLPSKEMSGQKETFAAAIESDPGLSDDLKNSYLNYSNLDHENQTQELVQDHQLSLNDQAPQNEITETSDPTIKPELNENEHQVFISLAQELLNSTGGQFGYADDAVIPEGMSSHQFNGYVSQLVQKNYFNIDDEFRSLLIGDKFEDYANQNNLFVGIHFQHSIDWIRIVGTPAQVFEENKLDAASLPPLIVPEDIPWTMEDIIRSAQATVDEDRMPEVLEPQDLQEIEQKAYDEYVSEGIGDSDGYFKPLTFEQWKESHLNKTNLRVIETIKDGKSVDKQSIEFGSQLLPDRLLNQIPVQQNRESTNDYEVHFKLFHPMSSWTMFVTEAEAVRDDQNNIVDVNLFGFVHTDGINDEWGYSSLQEIESTKVRGLGVERDLYFNRGTFGEVWQQFQKERGLIEEIEEIDQRIIEKIETEEVLFESVEITFSESPEIETGRNFLSVEEFDEFLATTRTPEDPQLYYKTDFQANFSNGTQFKGRVELQQGAEFTFRNLIIEDLESAKTVIENFAPAKDEKKALEQRIVRNEAFINAISIKAEAEVEVEQKQPEQRNLLNQYRITNFEDYGEGGLKTKFRRNVDALRTLQTIQEENRLATPEEQEKLALFSGWGGLKDAFDIYRPKTEWKKEIGELGLLYQDRDKEYFEARLSSENAHYTSPEISEKMWQIVQKLGFEGGRVLEPAAGVGNFIGLMPEELRSKTAVTAVEKEKTSAEITKQLYQKSRVINNGFENAALPDNSFDVVISNFPFGQYTVNDPNYNALNPSIHDYFFLKSLDKVREGGLVVALTSRFTLDKEDTAIREAIARRAELVGAYRLPETAFKDNAKTEVVTDLLIFQKRTAENALTKEEVQDLRWVSTDLMEIEPDANKRVNKYYFDNKENIIGKLSLEGRMYGKDLTVKVDSKEEMLEHFDRIIDDLKPVYVKNQFVREQNQPTGLTFEQLENSKEGGILISPENEIFQIVKGNEVKLERSKAETEKTIALVAIKEKVKEIFAAEVKNEPAETARQDLNTLYDGFYKKYGIINSSKSLGLLDGDPEAYLVKTLENYANEKTNTAEKASIFFESTLRGYSPSEEVGNINDAVAISLNEYARIDIPRISSLLKITDEEVIAQFQETKRAFFNHETEEWEIAEKYLSGEVKEKLAQVMEFAALSEENQAKVQNNFDALLEIQPKDLTYTEIKANMGASWIPPKDIKDFLIHLTKANADAIRVERSQSIGQWSVTWSGNSSSNSSRKNDASTKIWGTERIDTIKIAQCILDGRAVHITDPGEVDGKEVRVTNYEETEKGNQKLKEIQLEFQDWIWSDADRRQRLCRVYNDVKNTKVERKYDGSHLTLPNANPLIELRPHQKDAVWRNIQEPSSYMAHEVGTGKTLVLGASLIEKKRLGQVKKPVLAVMKANIKQVTAEIQKLYPSAKIFSGENGFDADSRKTAISNIATNNHDLVILTYNQLDAIPLSKNFQEKYINTELRDVNDSLAVAFEAEGKKSKMVSRLNKRVNNLEAQITKLIDQKQDDVVTFEETGIDCIGIDEAHNFKSLGIYTTMSNVKGVPTARSERAVNMHMRSQYMKDNYGEVRMIMASGTPVTNTVAESYTIMRFLMPDELKKQGIYGFDDFARDYTQIITKIEPTITGAYKEQSRLAEFVNTPELRQMMGTVLDVVKADEVGILRPARKDIVVSVPISEEQVEYRKELHQRASVMKSVDPREDNYLKLMNDGRLMAIDMRLLDEDAPDDPNSKVNYLVSNVLRIAKENPKATQLIFSNLGISESKQTGHSVFNDIIGKLEDGGIPRERIANFSGLSDKKRKEAIEKLNTGELLVALGSTDTLGTGVNAQKFIKASHNLDVPWIPSAIEQRDARSVRFGNIFADMGEEVELYRYVTQGTFDSIGWDTIRRKTEFINQVVSNKLGNARHFQEPDAEELTASQISAIASGNPDVLRKMELSDEVKQYSDMQTRHKQIALELADSIPGKEASIEGINKEYTNILADYELYKTNRLEDGDKFKVNLLGEDLTDYEEVSKILSREMQTCSGRKEIGKFCGFNVVVELQSGIGWSLRTPVVALESPITNNGYRFKTDDSYEIAKSMAGQLAHLKTQAEIRERVLEKENRELEDIKVQVNKPFRFTEELKNSQAELTEVEGRLRSWNREKAAEQERNAELKIEILSNAMDEEAKENQSRQIFDSLSEINQTRPTFTYPGFISKEDTEATIRGVEIKELANYRPVEIEAEEDEFEEEQSQVSLSFNEKTAEEIKVQVKEQINEKGQPNLLFGLDPEGSKMSEILSDEIKTQVSPDQPITEDKIEPQEKYLDEKDIAILKGQLILAQAQLKVLERDELIFRLTSFNRSLEVKNGNDEIIDRREFLEAGSTGTRIWEAKDADNHYKWSLEDVLIAKETYAQSLYEVGDDPQRKWSLSLIRSSQTQLEKALGSTVKEEEQQQKTEESQREFLNSLIDNQINPATIAENYLNSLKPEGLMRNLESKFKFNPIAKIEKHPLIQIGKAISELSETQAKEEFLRKTQAELQQKLETLTEVEANIREQLTLEKSEFKNSIGSQKEQISSIAGQIAGQEMPEKNIKEIKPELTAEELDQLSAMAIRSSNVELMQTYQQQMLENMVALNLKTSEFQGRFEQDLDRATVFELSKIQAQPVADELKDDLLKMFGSPEKMPANMLDAYEQVDQQTDPGQPTRIIEMAQKNSAKYLDGIERMNLFAEDERLSHIKGQNFVAEAFEAEMRQRFLPMTNNPALGFSPKMEAAQLIQSANDFTKSLNNFGDSFSQKLGIDYQNVQPMATTEEVNLLNDQPEDAFRVRIFDIEVTPATFTDQTEMDQVQNRIENKMEQSANDLANDVEARINAVAQQIAEIKANTVSKAAVSELKITEFLAL